MNTKRKTIKSKPRDKPLFLYPILSQAKDWNCYEYTSETDLYITINTANGRRKMNK